VGWKAKMATITGHSFSIGLHGKIEKKKIGKLEIRIITVHDYLFDDYLQNIQFFVWI
jgi:hypothetical protein